MSYFKAQLAGYIGKDATQREVNGYTVVSFTIPHSEGKGEKQITTWVNCNKWFRQGDSMGVVQYLKKGQIVLVDGTLSLRNWESNGKSGVSLEMRVNDIHLMGKSEGQSGSEKPAQRTQSAPAKAAGGNYAMPDNSYAMPASNYAMPGSKPATYQQPADDDLPF